MNEEMIEIFKQNGFTINNANVLMDELQATKTEPHDLLKKLLDLQNKSNINESFKDFSKKVFNYMNDIEQTLKSDDYFTKSDAKALENIKSSILSLNQKLEFVKNYLIAERNMLIHKDNLLNAKRKLYNLSKNNNISDAEKTYETIKLRNEVIACQNSYNDFNKFYKEQRNIYYKVITDTNIVNFKNDLLSSLNNLQSNCNNLALTSNSKDKISITINNLRQEISYYALDNIKSKNEFESICKRYSLTFDNNLRYSDNKSKNVDFDNNKDRDLNESNQKTDKNHNELDKDEEKDEEKKINIVNTETSQSGFQNSTNKDNKTDTETKTNQTSNDSNSTNGGNEQQEEKTNAQEYKTIDPNKAMTTIDTNQKTNSENSQEQIENNNKSKIKVVAKRTCNWINNHKKQILIAIGITALIITVIVALQYLIPAITTMLQSSQIATLSSAMVNNGALWHGALAGEQTALHAANTALASTIQSLTGTQAIYAGGSGVWTIGGVELSKFAATAMANASAAANTVTAITNSLTSLGVAGLGLTGLGAILPQKSEAYRNAIKKIKNIKKNMANMSSEEITKAINEVMTQVEEDTKLNKNEKNRLKKKSNRIVNQQENTIKETSQNTSTYENIIAEINELSNNFANLSVQEIHDKIAMLVQKIRSNEELTEEEKEFLVKKTKLAFTEYYKNVKKVKTNENQEELTEEESEERGR